jgi:ribosome biogenesis GTPase / thiamine phosphate phosphatase
LSESFDQASEKLLAGHPQDRLLSAQVIAAFGRQYLVRLTDGSEMTCLTRGKKSEVACGDIVEVRRTDHPSVRIGTSSLNGLLPTAQGVIEHIAPRRSLLHRSEANREKIIAANVTQIIVVVAAEPSFNDELLARCLVAAYDQKLEVLIVLNKCDLLEAAAAAHKRLAPYSAIGYRVLELSAMQDVSRLRPFLAGHSSVLVGQSGMGKSTLINALLPDAQAATREISSALDSGKHTTTHARLYRLENAAASTHNREAADFTRKEYAGGYPAASLPPSRCGNSRQTPLVKQLAIRLDRRKTAAKSLVIPHQMAQPQRVGVSTLIDCPGVQAFGLHHLSFGRIEQGFVEFAPYLGQCRFHDCHHLHEPGCALRSAVEAGKIDARRLALFQHITAARH